MRASVSAPKSTGVPLAIRLPLIALVAFIVIVLVGGVGGVAAFEVYYSGRAFPGVHLQGMDLTGMRAEEIFAAAQARAAYFRSPALTLHVAGKQVVLRPVDFGAGLDPASTTQRALNIGRAGDLVTRLREQAQTYWNGVDLAPVVLMDNDTTHSVLARLASEVQRAPRNASLLVENGAIQEVAAESGATLDTATSLALIQAAVMRGQRVELTLPMNEIAPQINNTAAAAEAARRLMGQDLVVMLPKWDANGAPIAGQEAFRIKGTDLPLFMDMQQQTVGSEVRLTSTLRRDKLQAMIEKLAPAVAQPVQDARFTFDDATNSLQVLQASKAGRALNVNATLDIIQNALNGDPAAGRTVSLVVDSVEPKVNSNATAQQLGITGLITQATTYFKGSSAARLTNVKVAASRFHGVVVAPHATFSFNEYLGDVSAEGGFEEGLVIVGDRTIKGVGGGVCQVSTTAYQAALRAGYPIVERYPHGYRVSYYERGMGPGFDATVFSPYVDFKFVNDSDAYLLMETYFDQARATLTFKYYGTSDGRQVSFTEPVISDVTPHGPDIYEPDLDNKVPAGQTQKVDYAVDGAKISVERTVTRNGETLIHERILSKYVPWQAVYRFGPGFTPPQGAVVR
jgi:vancomycin resistance protein YoaR